jgi:hypothetical protein
MAGSVPRLATTHYKIKSEEMYLLFCTVLCMFFGLPDLDPSLFCADLDPDPSINEQKSKKNLDFSFLVLF